MEDARTPLGEEARHAYAEVIGSDGATILTAVYETTTPAWVRAHPCGRNSPTGVDTKLHLD